MAGNGKGKGGRGDKKSTSRSAKAGLQFPAKLNIKMFSKLVKSGLCLALIHQVANAFHALQRGTYINDAELGFSIDHAQGDCGFTKSIKIGSMLSLKAGNSFAAFGYYQNNAAEMVVDYVNENCGITIGSDVYSLHVVTTGDQSSPTLVSNITKAYRANDFDVIIAPYASSRTDDVVAVTEVEPKNLVMAGGAATTSVFTGTTHAFGTLPPANKYFHVPLIALYDKGARDVVNIYEISTFPNGTAVGLWEAVDYIDTIRDDGKMNIVKEKGLALEGGAPTDESIETTIDEIVVLDPDVVIINGRTSGCVAWMNALRKKNYSPRSIVFTTCVGNAAFTEKIDANDLSYILGVSPWDSSVNVTDEITGWTPKEFNDLFEAKAKTKPTYHAASQASLYLTYIKAVKETQSLDNTVLKNYIESNTFNTVYAELSFDSNHQSAADMLLLQYQGDGRAVGTVGPVEKQSNDLLYPLPTWENRDCKARGECGGHGTCQVDGSCSCDVNYRPETGIEYETCAYWKETEEVISDKMKTISVILSVFGIISSISFAVITHKFKGEVVFKAASPRLVLLIIVGAMFGNVVPIWLIGTDLGPINYCQMSIIFFTISWALMFGTVTSRMYRVMQVFEHSNNFSKYVLKESTLFKYIFLYTGLELLYVIIWIVVDDFKPTKIFVEADNQMSVTSYYACEGESDLWAQAYLLVKALVITAAISLSFLLRNIPSAFNESKRLGFVIYNIAIMVSLYAVINTIVAEEVNTLLATRTLFVEFACILLPGIIVLPPLYIVKFRPEDNVIVHSASSSKRKPSSRSIHSTVNVVHS